MKFSVRKSSILQWFVNRSPLITCYILCLFGTIPAAITGGCYERPLIALVVWIGIIFCVPIVGIVEFLLKNIGGAVSDFCTGIKNLAESRSSDRSLERVFRGQFDRGQIEKISANDLHPEFVSREFFSDQLGRALGSEDSVKVVKSLNVGNEAIVLARYRFEKHVTRGAGAVKDDVRVVFVLLRFTLRPESGIVETELLTSFTEQAAQVGIDTMWYTSLRTIDEIREALGGGHVEDSTSRSLHTQGQDQSAKPSASEQIGRICVAG